MHPTFGRYELLKRLAGGGMGEVYLARQRGIDGFQKLLVVKTLLPHLCEDEEFINMFKDEARVTAQLIHPNICQVFEFDQVSGVFYMCMEYLRGEDLRRFWKACETKGTPLRVPLICRVIADAAAGLDFAHSMRNSKGEPYKIVHRDISPQNILVTFEGGVKVIDFGVAKAAGRAQHTRTGALKGKYSYMSPEQVAGHEIDGRSDIFALGIVLHELLTGRRLFKADSDLQTLARVREAQVPPPSRLNPQLPPGLDALVLKALAKNPDDRYRTAQEFRLALEDWLIQGRMSASSAHLAEFLKEIYAERLDKEARLGPLMGDPGFNGPAPGTPHQAASASTTPSSPSIDPQGMHAPVTAASGATVNQRSLPSSVIDRSMIRTESGAEPFKSGNSKRISGAVAAFAILAAAVFILRPPKKAPAPVELKVAELTSSLVAGPQQQSVTLQKATAQTHTVQISVEPVGTEIYEGSRLIGRSPKVWAGAPAGEHELTFRHDGYHDDSGKIVVGEDGDEFKLKPLRRIEMAKKAQPPPDLGIKAER